METIVRKWGNSLGIRIPNLIARELSLKDGSYVDISDKEKTILIRPVSKGRLADMINLINEKNIHKEVDTGAPVGNELW